MFMGVQRRMRKVELCKRPVHEHAGKSVRHAANFGAFRHRYSRGEPETYRSHAVTPDADGNLL